MHDTSREARNGPPQLPAEPPLLDEHFAVIEAGVEDVWSGLTSVVEMTFSGPGVAGIARMLGCRDWASCGVRPLAAGSTLPGFRVTAAVPGTELALEGRHRFSRYALIFRLEQLGPERTRLGAETRAAFPGLTGRVYRLLVIGTRGHLVVVKRLLAAVKLRTERGARAIPSTPEEGEAAVS
jgi:hypothetical protein